MQIDPGSSRREMLVVLGLVLAALVATFPGFHLLELYITRGWAIAISHSIGVVLLVLAFVRWRRRSGAAPLR